MGVFESFTRRTTNPKHKALEQLWSLSPPQDCPFKIKPDSCTTDPSFLVPHLWFEFSNLNRRVSRFLCLLLLFLFFHLKLVHLDFVEKIHSSSEVWKIYTQCISAISNHRMPSKVRTIGRKRARSHAVVCCSFLWQFVLGFLPQGEVIFARITDFQFTVSEAVLQRLHHE